MDEQKKHGMVKRSFDLPKEDAKEIKALAIDMGFRVSVILRFLVREALIDPDMTREKIKSREQSIKALGGRL